MLCFNFVKLVEIVHTRFAGMVICVTCMHEYHIYRSMIFKLGKKKMNVNILDLIWKKVCDICFWYVYPNKDDKKINVPMLNRNIS